MGPTRVDFEQNNAFTVSVMVASFKRTLLMAGLLMATIGETRVARGGKWQRTGRPDIDGPGAAFVLGVTQPDASNTGPRFAPIQTFGADQAPYVYTISSPGVYERFTVYGRIQVNNQTGVIINDVTVNMTAPPASSSVYGVLFNDANAHDNTLNYCLITVPNVVDRTEWVSSGIRGRGFLAYCCEVSFTTDGIHPVGKTGATITRDVAIHGCYEHDFTARFSAAQGTTHNDGVQSFGGVNIEIIGSRIHGGTTSCIILNYVASSGAYGSVTITDNWLYGDPSAGATINIATSSQPIAGLSVLRNRIDRNGFDSGQITVQTPNRIPSSFGATSGTTNGTTSDWVYGSDKNVYMDDGSEVRIQVG
jgi:hypothetical protein